MTAKIYLQVVDRQPDDTVLEWTGPKGEPMFSGREPDESLACGACKTIIGKHISTRTVHERFGSHSRLLFQCGCGAYLLAPVPQMPA